MIFYSRYAQVIGQALLEPRLSVFDEYRLPMRVWPGDVELTRMNNGQYLTLMDLGRIGLAVRCGLLKTTVRKRWTPLVGAVSIRYRRSLRVGQSFELLTRVVGFDEKYFYFDQRCEAGGIAYSTAFVKALFHGPRGAVSTPELLAAAGVPDAVSPPLPAAMRLWLESEDAMRRGTEAAS